MAKKYRIRLSEAERKYTHGVQEDVTKSKTIRKRAEIVLLSDESVGKPMTQEQIGLRAGVTGITVLNTIKRVCDNGLERTLEYKKRTEPPRPGIVTGEIEARIVATACGEPPKGYSRWTVRLLTEKVLELSILTEGSRETVRRTLKKLNLSLT
jgi:hypothetical protein